MAPSSSSSYSGRPGRSRSVVSADLRTEILDFGGLDSCIIFFLRGGILMSIGDFPEIQSQQILAGIFLVGRLGIHLSSRSDLNGVQKDNIPVREPVLEWFVDGLLCL